MYTRLAVITMMVCGLAAGVAGCGSSGSAGGTAATLQSIAVTPDNLSLGMGATQTYTATGTYSDATTQNISAIANWTSAAPTIASISTSGVVSALTLGSTNISATASGITGSTPLTVTAVTLQSISITPANLTLGTGAIQGYTVTGTYSDSSTQDITASASWISSATGVATVVAGTGVVTSVAAGTTTITATVNGVTGSTTLTVTSTPTKRLSSIAVTPAAASINVGATQQLTATATYTDTTTADLTSSVSWISANSAVAAVSSGGLVTVGIVAGVVGTGVNVTTSLGGASGKSSLTVTSPSAALTALIISPGQPFVYVGQSTSPITWVSGNLSSGIGQNPYPAAWTISGCAPANAAWIDGNGWVYGNAAGTCSITAYSGAITSIPATLTIAIPVLQSITIAPSTLSLAAGTTMQLSATGSFSDGSQKDLTNSLIWSSGNPAAATVGVSTGLLSAVVGGSATITATPVLPASNPPVTPATMTVTVPVTAPVQSTLTQPVVWDNTISISSLNSAWQTTTYAVNAYHNNSIAVGCNWFLLYDPIAMMQIQNFNCAQSLVKFDLAALAGKTIVSATLKLQTDIYGVGYVPRTWYIHALAAAWSGTSVTWNNAPGVYYVASASNWNPPTATNQIYNINVTNTVRNWVSGAWQNNGFAFGLNDVTFPYQISLDAFEFYSSEAGSTFGPQLIVTVQ